MSRAPAALMSGFKYQALVFWTYALRLLEPNPEIRGVEFETDAVKSFDDLIVQRSKPTRWRGRWFDIDCVQLKFHVDASTTFGWEDLINPAFIGATQWSFLQKAKLVLERLGSEPRCRLILRHYATIDPNDELATIYDNLSGGFRLATLFTGKTALSRTGKVRLAWLEHLGTDEDTLRKVLQSIQLQRETESLEQLRERVNKLARRVGLRSTERVDLASALENLIWDAYLACSGGTVHFDSATMSDFLAEHGFLERNASDERPPVGTAPSRTFEPKRLARQVLEAYKSWRELYAPLWTVEQRFSQFVHMPNGEPVSIFDLNRAAYVLLGESGSGKTVTLWALAVQAAEAVLADKPGARVPILVNLRELQSGSSVHDLVNASIGINTDVDGTGLNPISPPLLLLLDGLNEMTVDPETRKVVLRELSTLVHEHGIHSVVITCRKADFHPEWLERPATTPHGPINPPTYELERLQQNQVCEIVRRHFAHEPERGEELLSLLRVEDVDFWDDTESEAINLARIPMHLQLLIAEYVQRNNVSTKRAQLIRGFVEVMARARKAQGDTPIPADAVLNAARTVAFGMTRIGRIGPAMVFSRIAALRALESRHTKSDATLMLSVLESNNFLRAKALATLSGGIAPVQLEWLHQLVRDYLLACDVLDALVYDPAHPERSELERVLRGSTASFVQASELAMELLDFDSAVQFTLVLLPLSERLLAAAIHALPSDDAAQVAGAATERLLAEEQWASTDLRRLALAVPSLRGARAIRERNKLFSLEEREAVAEILSEVVIEFQDSQALLKEIGGIARAWIGSRRSDIVRFYGAKILWGIDRFESGCVLNELIQDRSSPGHAMAKQLARDWNMNS